MNTWSGPLSESVHKLHKTVSMSQHKCDHQGFNAEIKPLSAGRGRGRGRRSLNDDRNQNAIRDEDNKFLGASPSMTRKESAEDGQNLRIKNKRPDVQVYVPRARRQQHENDDENSVKQNPSSNNGEAISSTSDCSSNLHNARKTKIRQGVELYVPKGRRSCDTLNNHSEPEKMTAKSDAVDSWENVATEQNDKNTEIFCDDNRKLHKKHSKHLDNESKKEHKSKHRRSRQLEANEDLDGYDRATKTRSKHKSRQNLEVKKDFNHSVPDVNGVTPERNGHLQNNQFVEYGIILGSGDGKKISVALEEIPRDLSSVVMLEESIHGDSTYVVSTSRSLHINQSGSGVGSTLENIPMENSGNLIENSRLCDKFPHIAFSSDMSDVQFSESTISPEECANFHDNFVSNEEACSIEAVPFEEYEEAHTDYNNKSLKIKVSLSAGKVDSVQLVTEKDFESYDQTEAQSTEIDLEQNCEVNKNGYKHCVSLEGQHLQEMLLVEQFGVEHEQSSVEHEQSGDEHKQSGVEHEQSDDEHEQSGDEHIQSGVEHKQSGDEHEQFGDEHLSEEHLDSNHESEESNITDLKAEDWTAVGINIEEPMITDENDSKTDQVGLISSVINHESDSGIKIVHSHSVSAIHEVSQSEAFNHQNISQSDSAMEEEDEDSWDKLFDDTGEALDPKVMEELTAAVGKVEVQKPQFDYYNYQPKEPDLDYESYNHLIEIYDFPSSLITRDLIVAFKEFQDAGFDIKWVDDSHAIGIFSSNFAARSALSMSHPLMKVRPLSEATQQTKVKAKKSCEFLQPYRSRPETVALVARNMVAGALGLRTQVPKEKRDQERKKLQQAREKKKQSCKEKKEAWSGSFGNCAMDNI